MKNLTVSILLVLVTGPALIACGRGRDWQGEHNETSVSNLMGLADSASMEKYVLDHKGESITISGVVKEVQAGGYGSDWFFYMRPSGLDIEEELEIQVDLDRELLIKSTYLNEDGGVALCEYSDGRAIAIRAGEAITVTGLIWDFDGDWFGRKLLWIAGAVVNR
ncbi:MAG: hypothetical protein GY835_28280 [bacterium]|nr:hypothetical protein [bacterium]